MIETLKRADVPEVAVLFRALNTFHAERLPRKYHGYGADKAYIADLMQKLDQGAWLWGARDAWGLNAYLLALPQRSGASFVRHASASVLLDNVYVAPHLRGRGVFAALLGKMEARMRAEGYPRWVVGHYAMNTGAGARYEAAGAGIGSVFRDKWLS